VSGIIVATAVLARFFDGPDSRPHRSENSANSYSRLESWRSTRLMLTCRTDMIVARLEQHSRSRSFDRQCDRDSPSNRPRIWLWRGLMTGMATELRKAGKDGPSHLAGDRVHIRHVK
jgi:hypothetical protein